MTLVPRLVYERVIQVVQRDVDVAIAQRFLWNVGDIGWDVLL